MVRVTCSRGRLSVAAFWFVRPMRRPGCRVKARTRRKAHAAPGCRVLDDISKSDGSSEANTVRNQRGKTNGCLPVFDANARQAPPIVDVTSAVARRDLHAVGGRYDLRAPIFPQRKHRPEPPALSSAGKREIGSKSRQSHRHPRLFTDSISGGMSWQHGQPSGQTQRHVSSHCNGPTPMRGPIICGIMTALGALGTRRPEYFWTAGSRESSPVKPGIRTRGCVIRYILLSGPAVFATTRLAPSGERYPAVKLRRALRAAPATANADRRGRAFDDIAETDRLIGQKHGEAHRARRPARTLVGAFLPPGSYRVLRAPAQHLSGCRRDPSWSRGTGIPR